ncbi:ComF family protein [Spongisporangium articulatum]|uniref:ComF family protein n=1 Tax=Spongisporangium articulatum TaxID=3362603 RepID=A0ABW8AJV0_9ACTN
MALVSLAEALSGLVWPAVCAACGTPGAAVCTACARWYGEARWCPLPGSARPAGVWAACAYGGTAGRLVSAWKEHGRLDLTPHLAAGLTASVSAALRATGPPRCAGRVALVPVPTSRAARRRRGADLTADLAGRTARNLRGQGIEAVVVPALRLARAVQDQAGLGAEQRRENLAGAMRETAAAGGLAAARVLLVDDVVTTGATVREATKVLVRAGLQAPEACCLSVTLRRHGVLPGVVLH